jgi:tetratricopeptide (TPR) repeat protein
MIVERQQTSDSRTSEMSKDFPKDPETEAALLDAELFLKYAAPERAIRRLREALELSPHSLHLRERLREIAVSLRHLEEAARHCLALAKLYIERDDLEMARERLLEAKQLDPRLSIAAGLEAIRRAQTPKTYAGAHQAQAQPAQRSNATLSGDLSAISIFDIVQVLENARLTGPLSIESEAHTGRVLFNEGRIVDAETEEAHGQDAFRKLVEVTVGFFEFEKTAQGFPVNINAASNTNLILDSLRQLDEEKNE